MMNSMTVIPTHHPIQAALTTRYLMPGRAKSFALTQESVVDERPAFEVLLDALDERMRSLQPGEPLRILDLGCGVPFFLKALLARVGQRALCIQYTGIDISKEMIELFPTYIEPGAACRLELTLHSGINVPVEGLERALPLDATEPFDAIVSMQFSHYFANEVDSPLWKRFEEAKLTPLTKPDFWQRCHRYLKPQGLYADFDDTEHDDPEQHQRLEEAWDRYGLTRITNETFLSALKERDQTLYKQITDLYVRAKTPEDALKRYRETRLMRRRYDCEEIARRSFVQKNLSMIFSKVRTEEHPSLKNFYLWIAQK